MKDMNESHSVEAGFVTDSNHFRDRYHLFPFQFRGLKGKEVLTNLVGEHVIADEGTVSRIVGGEIDSACDLYKDLKSRQIIYDDSSSALNDLLATKYRTKKAFLAQGVGLHIVVVTLRCNHSCSYCQVLSKPRASTDYDMSEETILKSIELMIASSGNDCTLEIQGGEPLLAYEKVRFLIEQARAAATRAQKKLTVVLCSNLYEVPDGFFEYCKNENVIISTSLDGPEHIHNYHRISRNGDGFESVVSNIKRATNVLGACNVSALTTVTRSSSNHFRGIIDLYASLGLSYVFLRRMSRYGRARSIAQDEELSIDEFIPEYLDAIDYLIDLNRQGVFMYEAYYATFLRRILTPFSTCYVNLQSPPGAGTSVLAYHYNGDIYPLDEARMLAESGDKNLCMGNVHLNTHDEILLSPTLIRMIEEGCSESTPGCSDCAYLPYCGNDPVTNYMECGHYRGNTARSDTCRLSLAICDHIFGLIMSGDKNVMKILVEWAQ